MSQSNSQAIETTAQSFDEIVETYDLTILREPGDWTIADDGDLDPTKDGDPVLGDVAHNGLFRLVETWWHGTWTSAQVLCAPMSRASFASLSAPLERRRH